MHLSVVGWPKDAAGDEVEMGADHLAKAIFRNVKHVYDVTDLRVLEVRPALSLTKSMMSVRIGLTIL